MDNLRTYWTRKEKLVVMCMFIYLIFFTCVISPLHYKYSISVVQLISTYLLQGGPARNMTSKTDDNPPPYEDALHHPKYVNDPRNPQHGSSLPPPPSYSPSPGPPGYWAQEGVYPPAGMWAAPGHSPSGMPMTIPTLSGGLPASNTGSEEIIQGLRYI